MEVNADVLVRDKDQSKERKLMEVNAGGLDRGKYLSKETTKRRWKDSVLMEDSVLMGDSVLMEVNHGGLDRGNEGNKRHLKDSDDRERKKMSKNHSQAESYNWDIDKERRKKHMEKESYDWDSHTKRGKKHMDHETKPNLRHGKDAKKEMPRKYDKEMSRKYDKHGHCGGRRREKGHVEDREKGHVDDRGRYGERKKFDNQQHKSLGRKSESWNSNQGFLDLERNSNQGFLDRWVPTRDSDELRTQDLKSDQPSKEKGEEKKVKSAWLSEETERQHHSPVTLSDVEFSNDFDSRISGREFKIAQDYGHLKSKGSKERRIV